MSREYKLNKSELTRLKRSERLYLQYLPVLRLKQEQLQIEQNRINNTITEARATEQMAMSRLAPYIRFFADGWEVPLDDVLVVDEIKTVTRIIAGVAIRVFSALSFRDIPLTYYQTSPWLLRSLPFVKSYLHSRIHLQFLNEENSIVRRELRKATQKVNLFDKVLIPKTKEAIKRIKITLSDEHVAMVSRGKIAKAKKAHAA